MRRSSPAFFINHRKSAGEIRRLSLHVNTQTHGTRMSVDVSCADATPCGQCGCSSKGTVTRVMNTSKLGYPPCAATSPWGVCVVCKYVSLTAHACSDWSILCAISHSCSLFHIFCYRRLLFHIFSRRPPTLLLIP